MGLRPLLGPPCIPPETPPVLPCPKNTFFRGRLRTNLADVSASVLYNAAPGNNLRFARKRFNPDHIAYATALTDIESIVLPTGRRFFACRGRPENLTVFHSERKGTMTLRGAQGDLPTEGRGSPEAEAAQPSQNHRRWKTPTG